MQKSENIPQPQEKPLKKLPLDKPDWKLSSCSKSVVQLHFVCIKEADECQNHPKNQ